jgi:hypothetical protein
MSEEHVFVRSIGAQTPPNNRPTHASGKFMLEIHQISLKKITRFVTYNKIHLQNKK